MSRKHKIQTIQDILDAVNCENIDVFLADFEAVLRSKALLESQGVKITMESFIWIDDDKKEGCITIRTDEKIKERS